MGSDEKKDIVERLREIAYTSEGVRADIGIAALEAASEIARLRTAGYRLTLAESLLREVGPYVRASYVDQPGHVCGPDACCDGTCMDNAATGDLLARIVAFNKGGGQ